MAERTGDTVANGTNLDISGAKATDQIIRVVSMAEPIYRFCLKRVGSFEDAEDLSQEILADIIDGLGRRHIANLEAWSWTVARNCYAKRCADKRATWTTTTLDDDVTADPRSNVEEHAMNREVRESAFSTVIGLSELYRHVLVEFYVYGKSYREIARNLSIPLSSVKWRIYEGRNRFRERWSKKMNAKERVYDQIEWIIMCNGSMDPNRYLDRQINRAIASAAYEHAVSVEEISDVTGIPCLYIEDELEEMIYGEALIETGGKYETGFIVHRKDDRKRLDDVFTVTADVIAPKLLHELEEREDVIRSIGFYGDAFGLPRLMWILIPRTIRSATSKARSGFRGVNKVDYPLRRDGGHGWFNVLEGGHGDFPNSAGCNSYSTSGQRALYRYYWISRYSDREVMSVLSELSNDANGDLIRSDGTIDAMANEELTARMIACGLVESKGEDRIASIPIFTRSRDRDLSELVADVASSIIPDLIELLENVLKAYLSFTPQRLHDQITGNIGGYLHDLVGMVTERFVDRSAMKMDSPCRLVELVRGE
jgi:RNA polymerase sigma-70 factor, ECF subfamily